MGWGWIKEKLMRDEDGANQEQNEFKIFYHPLDDFDGQNGLLPFSGKLISIFPFFPN